MNRRRCTDLFNRGHSGHRALVSSLDRRDGRLRNSGHAPRRVVGSNRVEVANGRSGDRLDSIGASTGRHGHLPAAFADSNKEPDRIHLVGGGIGFWHRREPPAGSDGPGERGGDGSQALVDSGHLGRIEDSRFSDDYASGLLEGDRRWDGTLLGEGDGRVRGGDGGRLEYAGPHADHSPGDLQQAGIAGGSFHLALGVGISIRVVSRNRLQRMARTGSPQAFLGPSRRARRLWVRLGLTRPGCCDRPLCRLGISRTSPGQIGAPSNRAASRKSPARYSKRAASTIRSTEQATTRCRNSG